MVRVLRETLDVVHYWFVQYSDPRTDGWWTVATPIPLILVTVLYVYGSLKLGPRLMAKRKPFDLRLVIVVYNILQVVCNGLLFVHSIRWSVALPNFNPLCELLSPPGDTTEAGRQTIFCAYCYLMLKIADYMDTLFFVLRKQSAHISFLHVYHHALMGFVGYMGVRYAPGGNGWILVVANTLVHTIMYAYYGLSAMERTRDMAARWKKHITQLQLLQFLCVGAHYTQSYLNDSCRFPNFLCYTLIPQNVFMSAMFIDFYVRTYWRKRRPAASKPNAGPAASADDNNKSSPSPVSKAKASLANGNGHTNGTAVKARNGVKHY